MVVVVLLGCSQSQPSESLPEVTQLDRVVLLDVQGLWGGRDLWISGDGKAVCRFVGPPAEGQTGTQETRYTFTLPEKQLTQLLALVNKHRFFSIKIEDRSGVPDEARPSIFITSGSMTHAVGKWFNDKHEDFDPIYQHLRSIADLGKKEKATHQDVFDWDWKPDGFPERKNIITMTNPKID